MKSAGAPVGVFDSGVGGLSVAAAIRAHLPGVPILYYADTAWAPYGLRSESEIVERTRHCCTLLLARGVQALVVACNTATANAIDDLRTQTAVPVVGVEPGLKPAAAATRSGIVGVLATQATLASERYRRLAGRVQEATPGVRFLEHAARGWVELVEAGEHEGARADALVREAVEPLLEEGADALVLGCTHYPFLRAAIERAARGVSIIETGPAVARELERRMPAAHAVGGATGGIELDASGDRALLESLAAKLLGHGRPAAAPTSGRLR
jgi:glutamate racemase